MTIVCATHFSDSSSDAMEAAAVMARRAGERLVLATVVPATREPNGEVARLDELVASLRWDGGRVEGRVLRGGLGEAVRALCAEVGASLLVTGEDKSTLERRLFGAAVDVMAVGVSVPLLVVRDLRPFARWGEAALRVLLAVDTRARPGTAVDRLTHLSTYGALEVLAAHVWSPAQDAQAQRGEGTALLQGLWQSNDELLHGLPANVRHRVQLERGAPVVSEAFVQLAVKEHVDLIVLTTSPPGGLLGLLSSVSHEVLRGAPTSILFVPEGDEALLADFNPVVKEVSS